MKKTYKYAMLLRPPQLGACPMVGLIRCSCEEGVSPLGHHTWGWIEYNRKLSDNEIADYELEPLKEGVCPE